MKRVLKSIVLVALICTLAVLVITASACYTTTSYNGEYSYTSWGTHYGVKVRVDVQSDKKGDRIRGVELVESVYVEASPQGEERGEWNRRYIWDEGLDDLLLRYRGKFIADVLAVRVDVDAYGQPTSISDSEFNILPAPTDKVQTGATLGCGRLLLAVKAALYDAATALGYSVHIGEYSYTNWGTNYGIRVAVIVKDGVIQALGTVQSEFVEASEGRWEDKYLWDNNLNSLLESYKGRTVEEVLKKEVPCDNSGAPVSKENGGFAEEGYIISGATLGSSRLLLAVQDALSE